MFFCRAPIEVEKRVTIRRRLFYGFILVPIGLVTLGVLLWGSYHPEPLEVAIGGSGVQMGAQQGSAMSTRIRLLAELYVHRIVCQNDARLIEAREVKALKNLESWSPRYRDELVSMGNASGVSTGALAYANIFLDLGNVRAGCRSVVISATNRFMHAHNLDWDNLGGLGRWTTVIVRRNPADGRFKTVAVGFPGLVGALDIINERGIAVSFNQLGIGRGDVREPVLLMIRRIAESCASLDDARAEILVAPLGMPFILTVSDAQNGTASVFERAKEKITERSLSKGWVAACNQAQGSMPGSTHLDQVLADSVIRTPSDLKRVLAVPKVLMACNIYSVVFDYRENRLYLASGQVPAAELPFRSYTLFDETRRSE